jgi:hypothetical protein
MILSETKLPHVVANSQILCNPGNHEVATSRTKPRYYEVATSRHLRPLLARQDRSRGSPK